MSQEASVYESGAYLVSTGTWHVEDSPWKAEQVATLLHASGLNPTTFAEVGCGAGAILSELSARYPDAYLDGFEISPQAFALSKSRENERIKFRLSDIRDSTKTFEVLLILDVIEHIEDYFSFLRDMKKIADYKVLHVPLDANLMNVLRKNPIMDARAQVGHIHYFFKDTALASLRDCGYEVVDWTYTRSSETPGASKSRKAGLMNVVRRAAFAANRDFAARVLSGFSLLVLAR